MTDGILWNVTYHIVRRYDEQVACSVEKNIFRTLLDYNCYIKAVRLHLVLSYHHLTHFRNCISLVVGSTKLDNRRLEIIKINHIVVCKCVCECLSKYDALKPHALFS